MVSPDLVVLKKYRYATDAFGVYGPNGTVWFSWHKYAMRMLFRSHQVDGPMKKLNSPTPMKVSTSAAKLNEQLENAYEGKELETGYEEMIHLFFAPEGQRLNRRPELWRSEEKNAGDSRNTNLDWKDPQKRKKAKQ